MALFSDGLIAGITDLREYESAVLDVASTENIDLTHKLALAQRELGIELTAFLLQRGVPLGAQRELNCVVVTEPLLHWAVMRTLLLVYRDAYNSQLNDRYKGKRDEFAALAERAQRLLFEIGVGIVAAPIPKPPAPALDAVAGGISPAATYYARIAWSGLQRATGSLSEASVLEVAPGMRLTAAIPPAPRGCSGAFLYAGVDEGSMTRQNETAIAGGGTWVQPATGLRADLPALPVQVPDYYSAKRQDLFRG